MFNKFYSHFTKRKIWVKYAADIKQVLQKPRGWFEWASWELCVCSPLVGCTDKNLVADSDLDCLKNTVIKFTQIKKKTKVEHF